MQETHAKLALETLQPLAGDRDRNIEAACRGADGAEIEHAQKKTEVADAIHDYQLIIDTSS